MSQFQAKRTRGERNNNPLNLRYNEANRWKGQVGHDDRWFCVFRDMQSGIDAAARCIYVYMTKYDLHTIPQIVSRWAPSSENDTEAYIKTVCRISGCSRNGYFDYSQDFIVRLITAMARVESNLYLDRAMVKEAYQKAIH